MLSTTQNWDTLARSATFYLSSAWLDFAQTYGSPDTRRLARTSAGGRTMALPASVTEKETLAAYRPQDLLAPGTFTADAPPVTLGGRRGYLSGILAEDGLTDEETNTLLAGLVAEACAEFPAARGRWWWPYLPSADAGRVLAAASARDVQLVGADCVLDIPGTGLDDYVAALPAKQRRTNVRRELRAYADSGLVTRRFRLGEVAQLLGPLLAQVQEKYGQGRDDEAMSEYMRRMAQYLDASSVVFLCLTEDTGGLPDADAVLGFSLGFTHGTEFALRVVGFDYGRLPDVGAYGQLAFYEPLRHCYREGLRRLHLGAGSYEAKARRGARIRPLWAVAPGAPATRDDLAARIRELTAALPAREAEEFRREATAHADLWDLTR